MAIAIAVLVTVNILLLLYNVLNSAKITASLSALIESNNAIGMFIQEQSAQLQEPNTKIQNAEAKKLRAEAKLMEIQGEIMKKEISLEGKLGFKNE